jgi:hypothetical protein
MSVRDRTELAMGGAISTGYCVENLGYLHLTPLLASKLRGPRIALCTLAHSLAQAAGFWVR